MGFYVNSLESIQTHWERRLYQVYIIFLALHDESFDNFKFQEFLEKLSTISGKNIACYYFCPPEWNINVKRIEKFPVWRSEDLKQLKKSIVRGTRLFADMLYEKGIKYLSAISESRIHSFSDLGLLCFGRSNRFGNYSECIYIPINNTGWPYQFDLIFKYADKSDITYEKFTNHLKNKEKRILEHSKDFPYFTSVVIPGLITLLIEVIKIFLHV